MIFVGRIETDPLARFAFQLLREQGRVCQELGIHDHAAAGTRAIFTARKAIIHPEVYFYAGEAAVLLAAGISVPEEFEEAAELVALLPRTLSDFFMPGARERLAKQLCALEPTTRAREKMSSEGELARKWHTRDFVQ